MKSNEDKVVVLKLDQIDPNPKNAEIFTLDGIESLANNIAENGLIEYPIVKVKADNRYELIAGERRCAALRSLGQTEVKCIVRVVPGTEEALQQLIDSNIYARNLTPLELARVIREYMTLYKSKRFFEKSKEYRGTTTRERVAEALGISVGKVTRYLALLNLIPELQDLTSDPSFPYSALRPVAQLPEDKQREFYNKLNIIKDDYMLSHEDDDTSFSVSRKTVEYILKSMDLERPRTRETFQNPEIVASSINQIERVDVGGAADESVDSSGGSIDNEKDDLSDVSEIVQKPLDLAQGDVDPAKIPSFISALDSKEAAVDEKTNTNNDMDVIGRSIEKMLISIRSINGIIAVNRRGRKNETVKSELREYLKRIREYIDEIEGTL